jgi:toxin ParE1/3/4
MRILWTDQASEQLASAYDYVLAENPSAAEKQLEIVLQAVEQLANFPEMGRLGRVDGTRELVIQGTPYIVAYR